jgi:hypothetical protein
VSALKSRRRKQLCVEACRGIPDSALRAGGLHQALQVARAALGLAPMLEQVDIGLIRLTVENLERIERKQ